MPAKKQEIPKTTTVPQKSVKDKATGPASPAKPAPRPVKAHFKAGKDLES